MQSTRYLLYLSASLVLFYSVSTINELNTFTFERAEVKVMPNTGLKLIKHMFRKLNNTFVHLDAEVSLNRTYKTVFAHIVVYRQYSSNEFRKFLVDVWEDLCQAEEGGDGNILTKLLKEKTRNYTNIFRRCPYTPGIYYAKIKSYPLALMNFGQMLPSGRYRVEVNMTSGFQGAVAVVMKTYVSISDRRVVQSAQRQLHEIVDYVFVWNFSFCQV